MSSKKCDVLLYDNKDNPYCSLVKKIYGKHLITSEEDKDLLLLQCEEVNFSHHYFAELTLINNSAEEEGTDQVLERVYVPYQMIATVLYFQGPSKIGFHK